MNFQHFKILTLSLLIIPSFAYAQAPKDKIVPLTEKSIREFYDESLAIHNKSYPEYEAFMNAHTSADVQITMNSIALLDDAKPQTESITLNKAQMMKALPDDYKGGKDMKIDQKVTSIKISPDGSTALVRDTTVISGDVLPPNEPKAKKVGVMSQSLCEDTLTLNAKNQPQISKSICTTKTKISTNPQGQK